MSNSGSRRNSGKLGSGQNGVTTQNFANELTSGWTPQHVDYLQNPVFLMDHVLDNKLRNLSKRQVSILIPNQTIMNF